MNRGGFIEEIKERNLKNGPEQFYWAFNSRVHGPYSLTIGVEEMFLKIAGDGIKSYF